MFGRHLHPHTHYAGVTRWRRILGIRPGWHWLVDPRFALAVLGAVAFWGVLGFSAGAGPLYPPPELLSLILLQPVVEELLFRGLLQGHLLAWSAMRHHVAGLTVANIVTATAFTALHFGSHPPLWAAGVFVPALLFGYFRDRHHSVVPAIVLHVFYNAGYFLLPLLY